MPAKSKAKSYHWVSAKVNNWELARRESAVRFVIYKDEDRVGKLKVGRGSISWTPRGKQVPYVFTWDEFSKLMETT